MRRKYSRRDFIKFLGRGTLAASIAGAIPISLSACSGKKSAPTASETDDTFEIPESFVREYGFHPLPPSQKDELAFAPGFTYQMLFQTGDKINQRGEKFGDSPDYIAYFSLHKEWDKQGEGLLWVNHEFPVALFQHGQMDWKKKTKAQVEEEMRSVGGSILHIKRDSAGEWNFVKGSKYNRRIHGLTKIPFVAPRPILGAKQALGTLGNCAGGVTPWGTVLTCEENYHYFYGEAEISKNGSREVKTGTIIDYYYNWFPHYPQPPEHYGWVVEIEPRTGKARKLTALGRFAHESATVVLARDGRCVVYMGDDQLGGCFYKFVAKKKSSLDEGELFVANIAKGEWISLDRDSNPKLKEKFADQLDCLIRTREAADIVGGSKLDRPEDVELDPQSGAILVALTNNKPKLNFHGSIMKIVEQGGDPLAKKFNSETFLTGGDSSGVASPDNMAFDWKGNLWLTTDMAGNDRNMPYYKRFGNNSLFFVPSDGAHAGKAFRVATAPIDAEFTGPCFSPDGRTLFLSVQHPGETSDSRERPTSRWPDGGNSLPRSAVIAIGGPAFQALMDG